LKTKKIAIKNIYFFGVSRKVPLGNFISQSKTSADIFIDYCGIIQNIDEQCGGVFIVDIYLKISEDNELNNLDKYFFPQIL